MKKIVNRYAGLAACIVVAGVILTGCNSKGEEEIILNPTTTVTQTVMETASKPQNTETDSSQMTQAAASETSTTENTATVEESTTTEPVVVEPTVKETTTETTTEPTTVETTAETTAAPSTQAAVEEAKPWDLLNNEPLNPTKSGYQELDNLIEGYFSLLRSEGSLSDDMSPYQKVHNIYVWFIKRIVYNRGMNVNAGQYSSSDATTTPEEVLWATDLLNVYQGCCYNYSSAFMYIMRALGYDAHLLSGQVGKYGGGTTPHCWVYVNLGGTAYTFDPDIDMNYYWRGIDSGVENTDTLFCRRMDTMSSFYIIEKYHDN